MNDAFQEWYSAEVAAGRVPVYDVSDHGPDWPALMRTAWDAAMERCAARAEQEAAEYDAMEPDCYDPARVCRALAKAIREVPT